MLDAVGLKEPALATLAREAYKLLDIQSYFTCGPKEIRAWTIPIGATGPQAAGVIHTDFEKGYIRAEVYTIAGPAAVQDRSRDQGGGQAAQRGQGVRHEGRRRRSLPVQRVVAEYAMEATAAPAFAPLLRLRGNSLSYSSRIWCFAIS